MTKEEIRKDLETTAGAISRELFNLTVWTLDTPKAKALALNVEAMILAASDDPRTGGAPMTLHPGDVLKMSTDAKGVWLDYQTENHKSKLLLFNAAKPETLELTIKVEELEDGAQRLREVVEAEIEWLKNAPNEHASLQGRAIILERELRVAEAQKYREQELLHDPLTLAILFHHTYERLAPSKGYDTRKDTRIFDPESPNGKLMIAVCDEIQKAILKKPLFPAP